MKDPNTVYTATLKFTTTGADLNAMHVIYEWDPPFNEVVKEFGDDINSLPFSYQHMAHLLSTVVLPRVMMSERYEEEFLEEPTIADILEEQAGDTVH